MGVCVGGTDVGVAVEGTGVGVAVGLGVDVGVGGTGVNVGIGVGVGVLVGVGVGSGVSAGGGAVGSSDLQAEAARSTAHASPAYSNSRHEATAARQAIGSVRICDITLKAH